MTATADFMNSTVNPDKAAMINTACASRKLDVSDAVRGYGLKVVGVALILAAAGMWLAPGANWSSELLLIKLAMSLAFVLGGLAMVQGGQEDSSPEIEFDQIRREVRVICTRRAGSRDVLARHTYDELGAADASDGVVSLWDASGKLLVSLPVKDAKTLKSLNGQLKSLMA